MSFFLFLPQALTFPFHQFYDIESDEEDNIYALDKIIMIAALYTHITDTSDDW